MNMRHGLVVGYLIYLVTVCVVVGCTTLPLEKSTEASNTANMDTSLTLSETALPSDTKVMDEQVQIILNDKMSFQADPEVVTQLQQPMWVYRSHFMPLPKDEIEKSIARIEEIRKNRKKEPTPPFNYQVQYGETLPALAERFYKNRKFWVELYNANRDRIDKGILNEGQIIHVPKL